jgi:hypothetical protein
MENTASGIIALLDRKILGHSPPLQETEAQVFDNQKRSSECIKNGITGDRLPHLLQQ